MATVEVNAAGNCLICTSIKALHSKDDTGSGMTDGYCSACGWLWPCPTYHLAAGYGDVEDCIEEKWCDHMKVVMQ